jgi:hypothetical protein
MLLGWSSPGQVSSQSSASAQLTEQLPVQVIEQLASGPQEMLELGPTVKVQLAPIEQSTLHEVPQLPSHMLLSLQSTEQLSGPQTSGSISQLCSASQTQLAPLQAGSCRSLSPHPQSSATNSEGGTRGGRRRGGEGIACPRCADRRRITRASQRAAEPLGLTDVGPVRAGFRADLVVVDGDPLKDPKLLEARRS